VIAVRRGGDGTAELVAVTSAGETPRERLARGWLRTCISVAPRARARVSQPRARRSRGVSPAEVTATSSAGGTPALPLSAWRGQSGRRYVVGIHALDDDPSEVATASPTSDGSSSRAWIPTT
jgi:hypothetical protein